MEVFGNTFFSHIQCLTFTANEQLKTRTAF